jgi:hypothetical protein
MSELQIALDYWQKALGLGHWTIAAYTVPPAAVDYDQAEVHADSCRFTSTVTISDNAEDWERSLVHELLHLALDPMQLIFEAATPGSGCVEIWGIAEHQVVNRMAQALVDAKRGEQ